MSHFGDGEAILLSDKVTHQPLDANTIRKAQLVVAGRSEDAEEARALLAMLGILEVPEDGMESGRALPTPEP